MTRENESRDTEDAVRRRNVLKMTGSAVVAGGAIAGTASANNSVSVRDDIVFCGCSQVCYCDVSTCKDVKIIRRGAEDFWVYNNQPNCVEVEEGQIIAIAFPYPDPEHLVCNPNTACADFSGTGYSRDDCTALGTRPQDGARCGGAFLRETCGDGSNDNGGKATDKRGNGRGH